MPALADRTTAGIVTLEMEIPDPRAPPGSLADVDQGSSPVVAA